MIRPPFPKPAGKTHGLRRPGETQRSRCPNRRRAGTPSLPGLSNRWVVVAPWATGRKQQCARLLVEQASQTRVVIVVRREHLALLAAERPLRTDLGI